MFMVIKETKSDLFFVESAILLESGLVNDMDKVLCVTAPSEVRIERAMKRDGVTREEVEKRMLFQVCDERRLFKSDYVVDTNQNLDDTKTQLFEIINRIK
jgi:dephospho-CoA kinase